MVAFPNPGRNATDGTLRWQQQLSPHGNGNGLGRAPSAASESTPTSSSASPALQGGSSGASTNRPNHAHMISRGPPSYSGSNAQLSGSNTQQHRPQNSWSDSSTLNLLSDTAARQADEDHSGPSSRRGSLSPTPVDKAMGTGSVPNGKPVKRTLEGHKKVPSSASLTAEADSSLSYSRGQSESDHEGGSPSDRNAEATEEEKRKKRTKTARACDSCRRKKIRCDVIDDGSPAPGDPNNGNGGLTCAHCRQYGFSCTFFLPITETRFKKKREREAEAAAAAAASRFPHGGTGGGMFGAGGGSRPAVSPHGSAGSPLGASLHASVSAAQEWPPRNHAQHLSAPWDGRAGDNSSRSPGIAMANIGQGAGPAGPSLGQRLDRLAPPMSNDPGPPPGSDQGQPPDTRVLGPTSLAYIVHSTAFVPGSAIEAHDLKHSQTFEVGASGDGIIKLNRSRHRHPSFGDSAEEDDDSAIPQIPDAVRGRLTGDVAEKLINSYFEKIGYLWPVVTKSEFLHLSHPPPLLFYAICGVAALDRNVPIEVLSAVRTGLNAIFKDSDVLSNSSALTVKALLVLSLHSDIHGSANLQSGTRLWNRLGIALRMAQDLGLHRDASGRDDLDEFAHFLEQKRRIWGACVSADRCVSIALGHPLAIDLTDCDVRLPSPYEIQRFPTDLPSISGVERPFAFNTEMLKLSILFGRVQKTIYSPTGLMKATDDEIAGLLNDIDQWRERLPEELHFTGPTSSPPAGILHLSHACIQMLFFRVFMRISYSCPQHLKFSLTIERMTSMVKWSRESIAWVDVSGDIYFDTMQFISYALVFCATIQYHSWIRRGDEEGLKALAKLKEIFTRGRHQDGQKQDMSLRAKTAEIVSLLCEAAQGHWANTPSTGNLNPTAGVVNRRTVDSVKGITWKNAPGRPGGGVFEAADASLLLGDLPNGTIILGANRTPALVMTSSNGWQPVPGVLPEQHPKSGLDQSSDSADLPDLSNFTYLGGSVWQDESGRPVDRRGSGLMVVLPTSNQTIGEQMGLPFQQLQLQQQQHQHQQQQHQQQHHSQSNQQQQHHQQYTNVNPHLNHLSAVDQAFAAQQHTTPLSSLLGGDPGHGGGIPGVGAGGAGNYTLENLFGSGTGGGTPGGLGGIGLGGGGGGGANLAMGVPADPMMLNDPLMGILDWQAWQSYLAPFSNSSNNNNANNNNNNNSGGSGANQNSSNPNGHSSGSAGAAGGGGGGGLMPGGGSAAARGRSPAQSNAHGIGSGAA